MACPTSYASGSTVDILINNRNSQVLDFESVISDLSLDNGTIDTEVEVLNSRSLAGRVVDELNLTDNPEFNSSLQEPGFIKSLLSGLKGSLNLLRPSQVEEYSDDEDLSDFLVRENVITSLLNKVSIRRVGITYVIEVSVETESPRRSRDIANEYANQYIL